MSYLIWLIFSVFFFALGEFASKEFALHPGVLLLIFLLTAYTISVLLWLPVILQRNQLAVVGTLWTVLGLVATVAIGVIIFHEKLSIFEILGICVGLVAVVLLSIS